LCEYLWKISRQKVLFFLADCWWVKDYNKMDGESESKRLPDRDQPTGNKKRQSFGSPETRRQFLKQFTVTTAAMTLGPQLASMSSARAAEKTAPISAENAVDVHLKVNGKDYALKLDPRTTLLDCLREHLHLTGSKKGCDHGQCGACTVHINGRRVNSCLSFAAMHEGEEITTIEGVGQPENLHPVQAAFVACDAYQCGYCTSGQIMSAVALLKEPCGPEDAEVKEFMSGNICRCGAYPNIVAAIQSMRKNTKPAKPA
jgi:xanthine dehydrogenase YagT iron-sulfur-binding subunit